MYDGIFDDVERVKKVLASHGHQSVDETLVFELLEDLKVTDHVVKILLGTRLRLNTDSSDSSWNSNHSLDLEDSVASVPRDQNPFYSSATVEDSCSSDDLEVIEHNVVNPVTDAVDLTIDDNQSESDRAEYEEIKTKTDELITLVAQSVDPLIDVTKQRLLDMEAKAECCGNKDLKDIVESKTEDTDSGNSELGMDDYYRPDYRAYIDSEESQGSDEFDGKLLFLPSGALAVSPVFENQGNNDASNSEAADNRMEEMLEENNNDPNNNLEDIEALGQNNTIPTVINHSSREKEAADDKCGSPKPGCSKDSYYADTDFCLTEHSAVSSNGTQRFTVGKRPNIANIFEDEDFLVGNCVRLSDTKIGQEVFMIQKILPNFTKAKILSAIMRYQEASNRVEIALWDLLPDDRPAPIFPFKRKQKEDNCPSPVKKFVRDQFAENKKRSEPQVCKEKPGREVATSDSKYNIIKPAKLKVTEAKIDILKPSKLTFSNPKPPQAPIQVLKSRSTVMLKPSKLKNVTSVVAAPKNLKQSSSAVLIPAKLEMKPKASTQVDGKKSAIVAWPKLVERLTAQPKPDKVVKTCDDTMKANGIKTGAIPKTVAQHQTQLIVGKLVNQVQESKVQRPALASNAMQIEPQVASQKERVGSKLDITSLNQNVFKCNVPGGSENHARAHSSGVQVNQLNVKLHPTVTAAVPTAVAATTWVDVHPPKVENRDVTCRTSEFAADSPRTLKALEFYNQRLMQQFFLDTMKVKKIANKITANPMQQLPEPWKLNPVPVPAPLPVPLLAAQPAPLAVAQPAPLPVGQPAPRPVAQPVPLPEPAAANALPAQRMEHIEQPRVEKKEIPPPKKLFNPLINMFPDVDPNYITELCISAKSKNQGLESLVEVLLISGEAHPRIINPEPEPQEINADAQYENLQGIFPDAHPEYLRGIAEQYYRNPDAMKDFVQTQLENPDYPTMADYLKKIKITEQIKQYTVEFSAEQFLEIFPDPFAYFEDPKRVYRYNVIAFEFLKSHFKKNKVNTILRAYRSQKCGHHLSLAAKTLEAIGPDMKTKRTDRLLPIEDIPLLQECAFIKHKEIIRQYMQTEKLKEQQEFKRLQNNNELLECQCCYDGECMPSKCSSCSEGHIFCNACIKTGSATKIGEGQTNFPCFVECKGEFTLPVLQKVLEPTTFSILIRKRQEAEVKAAGLEGLVSCPFCHFASIPPPEDKVFKCLNPECMKESCRLCKELNHVPLRCEEVDKRDEARHYLEEKMTEALVRKCYSCSRPFFKDEGCNKMTCPCGAKTCYICGEAITDYQHFNGQGSDRTDLCPLWSDNKMLNAQSVRVIAKAAEKEILRKNPHLKIDARALMPSLPKATAGPHQDIANGHILPVHIRRM